MIKKYGLGVVSTSDLVKELGCTRFFVQYMVQRGAFHSARMGGDLWILSDSVQAWKDAGQPCGKKYSGWLHLAAADLCLKRRLEDPGSSLSIEAFASKYKYKPHEVYVLLQMARETSEDLREEIDEGVYDPISTSALMDIVRAKRAAPEPQPEPQPESPTESPAELQQQLTLAPWAPTEPVVAKVDHFVGWRLEAKNGNVTFSVSKHSAASLARAVLDCLSQYEAGGRKNG